jgi:hypothetical protein
VSGQIKTTKHKKSHSLLSLPSKQEALSSTPPLKKKKEWGIKVKESTKNWEVASS